MLTENFLNYVQSLGRSKNTNIAYAKDIRDFEDYFKNRNITEITRFDLDNFFKALGEKIIDGKPLSNATRARKVSTVKLLFKYLVDVGVVQNNIAEHIKSPKIVNTREIYLSIDESKKLISSVKSTTNKTIITFLLNTGLRISELININAKDIQQNVIIIKGKGDKKRRIFLNQMCQDQLDKYLKEREVKANKEEVALFVSSNGNRMCVSNAQNCIKREVRKVLNRSDISAHKLRHSFATMQLKVGTDLKTLQKQMGHSDIKTTMLYTHIDNDQTDEAFKNNPLSRS